MTEEKTAGCNVDQPAPVTVFLVDDDPDVLATTADVLSVLGYEVVVSGDPLEAVDVYLRHQARINVAMLDVCMPGIDGVTLARRLRDHTPSLPVVYLTGAAPDDFGIAALDNALVVRKPYSIDQVVGALERAVDAPAQRRT